MDVTSAWSIIPFVGMLLSIAILPMIPKTAAWYERHQLLVALFWACLFMIPYTIFHGIYALGYELAETVLLDYVPFIVLLLGLFVVSGGIAIKGKIAGTTRNNMILLLVGTVLASWVGTTGAAMLLIRPVLRANQWRKYKVHIVVFFIFLVANMGGCLTPLGDPPLFLGYLRGVPFFWTIEHIWPILLFNVVVLMIVFFLIDRHYLKKELAEGRSPSDIIATDDSDLDDKNERVHIVGKCNFIFLAMIILAVILNGALADISETVRITLYSSMGDEAVHLGLNFFVEIILIGIAIVLSLKFTPQEAREHNEFGYGPIAEVAKLFIGIFITMIPALMLLREYGSQLGIDTPLEFFWATGLLSSFLDNSPTYVVFLTTAGSLGAVEGVATTVGIVPVRELLAISAGAVFMGANTYIGNAPNFMVKNISEMKGVKMPSFFGYMGWSLGILIPVFLLDSLLFFL
jgi:Na+/H+ antiporter NhaD/arsenite permease-like protein